MSETPHQPFKDYFAILGISPESDQEAIKAAYRELVFTFHPDRNQDPEAHRRFLEVGEAYRVLTEPDLRRRYLNRYYALRPSRDQEKLRQSIQQRQQINREKRATRYRAGRYTQRMRYRGASSRGGNSFRQERPRARTYTEPVDPSWLEAEAYGANVGYQYYALFMRVIALCIIGVCGWMWADFFLAASGTAEKVNSRRKAPRVFVAPDGIQVNTERSRFLVHASQARLMPPEREVTLLRSPWRREVTHVRVTEDDFTWTFRVLDGTYGVHFWLTYLVGVLALLTLVFRKNVQANAHLGTFMALVALSVFGLIFSA